MHHLQTCGRRQKDELDPISNDDLAEPIRPDHFVPYLMNPLFYTLLHHSRAA